jgi:hypothetical protein
VSFLGGIFGGSNPTLNNNIGQLGQISGSATTQGQSDTSAASNFFQSLLQGKTTSLAPQIAGIQGQTQNKIQSLGTFGNRSGGTNASANTAGDQGRVSVNNLVQGLVGGAASSLGSLGTSLQGIGLSAMNQQTNASQTRLDNWKNSIFGKSISSGIGAASSIATDGLTNVSAGNSFF